MFNTTNYLKAQRLKDSKEMQQKNYVDIIKSLADDKIAKQKKAEQDILDAETKAIQAVKEFWKPVIDIITEYQKTDKYTQWIRGPFADNKEVVYVMVKSLKDGVTWAKVSLRKLIERYPVGTLDNYTPDTAALFKNGSCIVVCKTVQEVIPSVLDILADVEKLRKTKG